MFQEDFALLFSFSPLQDFFFILPPFPLPIATNSNFFSSSSSVLIANNTSLSPCPTSFFTILLSTQYIFPPFLLSQYLFSSYHLRYIYIYIYIYIISLFITIYIHFFILLIYLSVTLYLILFIAIYSLLLLLSLFTYLTNFSFLSFFYMPTYQFNLFQ